MISKKAAAPQQTTFPEADRIKQVRNWISTAEHEGVPAADMLLRLTSRDASALKRHPAVAEHEISFVMGEMRFLGVKVEEGGITVSVLERVGS